MRHAMWRARWTLGLAGLLAFSSPLVAKEEDDEKKVKPVEVGDKAPEFKAKADSGKEWSSKDHVGKKTLVLFFFPAAMTGG